MINVPVAAQAYVARLEAKEKGNNNNNVNTEALQAESEKLAKERRELRAEMARMRKEMDEASTDSSKQLSVEERLKQLQELHEKKLITDAEYERKRKEILNDI